MPGINFVDLTNRPFLDSRIKSAFHFFAKVAIPGITAGEPDVLTLETNAEGWKTPASASNPNAFYLGCTTEGWTITLDEQKEELFCDEAVDPESTVITSRKIKIEGNVLGALDDKILTELYGMTRWDNQPTDTFRHYGASTSTTPPSMSVLAVFQREASAGVFKYGYFFFPNCEQTASYPGGKLSRKERLVAPVSFAAKAYSGYGGRPFTKYFEE